MNGIPIKDMHGNGNGDVNAPIMGAFPSTLWNQLMLFFERNSTSESSRVKDLQYTSTTARIFLFSKLPASHSFQFSLCFYLLLDLVGGLTEISG